MFPRKPARWSPNTIDSSGIKIGINKSQKHLKPIKENLITFSKKKQVVQSRLEDFE